MLRSSLVSLFLIILLANLVLAIPGNIQTVNTCAGIIRPESEFYNRGTVFINISNFEIAKIYIWNITGFGNTSCDTNNVVANGTYNIGGSGNSCWGIYIIPDSACGNYQINFGGKKAVYHIIGNPFIVPEYGLAVGIFIVFASLMVLFMVRRVK